MKRFAVLLQIFVLCCALVACSATAQPTALPTAPTRVATLTAPTPTPRPTDLVGTATQAANLATLVTAIQAANLVEKLKSPGPFTIFAPTDQAFSTLDSDTLNDKQAVSDILLYHIAATRVLSDSLVNGATIKTLLGDNLTIHKDGKIVKVGEAEITLTPLKATNGLIYLLDKVLLPPDKAVVSAPNATITQILTSDRRFSTLVTALKATGVYTDLQGTGPFTVFAPTQQAFTVLPTSLVDSLFHGPQVWTRVLHYHIIPGKKILATEFTNQEVEQTQEGSTLVFSKQGNSFLVEQAKITQTDIQAANGVIHVIDKVLVPPLD
jgi:transforming growth factor-beta-induced protein